VKLFVNVFVILLKTILQYISKRALASPNIDNSNHCFPLAKSMRLTSSWAKNKKPLKFPQRLLGGIKKEKRKKRENVLNKHRTYEVLEDKKLKKALVYFKIKLLIFYHVDIYHI
jgi:hypothetical protein